RHRRHRGDRPAAGRRGSRRQPARHVLGRSYAAPRPAQVRVLLRGEGALPRRAGGGDRAARRQVGVGAGARPRRHPGRGALLPSLQRASRPPALLARLSGGRGRTRPGEPGRDVRSERVPRPLHGARQAVSPATTDPERRIRVEGPVRDRGEAGPQPRSNRSRPPRPRRAPAFVRRRDPRRHPACGRHRSAGTEPRRRPDSLTVTMVTTRPARPGDTAFLASVMLASSRSHLPRGAWDLMLDAPDDVCLDFLWRMASAEPATFCHWRAFLIAEVDGEPAAALAGFDPGALADPVPAIERTLSRFGWTPEDVARGNERLVPFFTCVPQWIPGLWRVEWVATRP